MNSKTLFDASGREGVSVALVVRGEVMGVLNPHNAGDADLYATIDPIDPTRIVTIAPATELGNLFMIIVKTFA